MEFAHIVPVKNLDSIKGQRYNMFLTHLVEGYQVYRDFAKQEKGFKILDNSLIELGDTVSIERVIDAAYKIEANEIILPDCYLNYPKTVARTFEALNTIIQKNIKDFRIMAVVHGANEDDWFKCFEAFNCISEIHTLGIPKVTNTLHEHGRPHFVNEIKTEKDLHLLGVWTSVTELEYIDVNKVRGVDTSLPAVLALFDKPFTGYRKPVEIIDLDADCVDPDRMAKMIKEVNNYVTGLHRVQRTDK